MSDKGTEFLFAVKNNKVELVHEMLQRDVGLTQHVNMHGETALHVAVSSCHSPQQSPTLVRLLVNNGASVHARDNDGNTPLMKAVSHRQPCGDVTRLLLAAGARIDITNRSGASAIYLAVIYDRVDILYQLFASNLHRLDATTLSASTTTSKDVISPIHCAAFYHRVDCLMVLLDQGFDPNLQIDGGLTVRCLLADGH